MTATTAGQGMFSGKRVLILVGLLFLSLPGWLAGIYLLLKWTRRIQGLSARDESAVIWSGAAFVVTLVGLIFLADALKDPGVTSYEVGAGPAGMVALIGALIAGAGTFHVVRKQGPPRASQRVDWTGFWIGIVVAVVGFSVSMNSYAAAAAGGGRFVVLWGAVLWGGWKVVKSLTARPGGASAPFSSVPGPKPPPVIANQLHVGERVRFGYRDTSRFAGVRGLITDVAADTVLIRSEKSGKDVRVRLENIAEVEFLSAPAAPRTARRDTDGAPDIAKTAIGRPGDLVTRLAELDAARSARLISPAEYDAKRASILETH